MNYKSLSLVLIVGRLCSVAYAQEQPSISTDTQAPTEQKKLEEKTPPSITMPERPKEQPLSAYEAQQVLVNDTTIATYKGAQTAAILSVIPESDFMMVSKVWERAIKNKTKNKPVQQGNMLFLSQTVVSAVAEAPLDVYYHLDQRGANVRLIAGFESGGAFFSPESTPERYEAARKFVRAFAVEQYQASVDRVLDAEKKRLNDLQNEQDKLYREKKKLESLIADRTQDIRAFERDVNANEGVIKAKDAQIAVAREQLAKTSPGEYYDSQEKTVKTMERDRQKLENANRRMREKTIDYKGAIERAKQDVKQNEKAQPAAAKLVEDQNIVVDAIKAKRASIK